MPRHAERTEREHHRNGPAVRAQQGAEQLDRRWVGPLEVVEHQDERPPLGQKLEQDADGAMAAIALVLQSDLAGVGEGPQRRQDLPEFRSNLVVERAQALRVETRDVLIQRIDEDRQREVALELRRRSAEDELPACVRASTEFRDEARLADPWLAEQRDGAGLAAVEVVEQSLECSHFGRPPDQVPGTR
jgi:hypothetical protein